MAEEQANAQVAAAEAGQASAGQQEVETFDAEYVKGLRAEAAKYRKTAQEAAAKVATFEQERMTEAERVQAQVKAAQTAAETAQAELRKARAGAALATAAARQGIDPDLLAKLVDVEFDEGGQPVNIDLAVGAVLKRYPQLKPTAVTQIAASNPGRERSKLTMDEVKAMSPEEINRRWDEVSAVLASNK